MSEMESYERKRLRDAWRLVWRAIEGGLLDDVRPTRWPDLDWRDCNRNEFHQEIAPRLRSLLGDKTVTFDVRSDRYADAFIMEIPYGPNYKLRTTISGQVVRRERATGRRA